MLIGAHVKGGASVAAAERGAALGAEAIQVFTQSPRQWRAPRHGARAVAEFRAATAEHRLVTYCHATYLINLAGDDAALRERSAACLRENLSVARRIGARGLVLHVGSHKGRGGPHVSGQVADALRRALDDADPVAQGDPGCPILLENAAGAGGTVGRSLEELAELLEAAGSDERLGVCLDTQHLFASGVDFTTRELADRVVAQLDALIGCRRLGCLHLNDSKVALGANRDRHENLGEGHVGADGLAALLGHPKLSGAPALLEVPGSGDGPRASDVATARRLLELGRQRRRRRRRTTTTNTLGPGAARARHETRTKGAT